MDDWTLWQGLGFMMMCAIFGGIPLGMALKPPKIDPVVDWEDTDAQDLAWIEENL